MASVVLINNLSSSYTASAKNASPRKIRWVQAGGCVTGHRPVVGVNDGFKQAHGFQRKDAKAQRCKVPHTLFAAPRLCALALNLFFTSPFSTAATRRVQTPAKLVTPSASGTRARNKESPRRMPLKLSPAPRPPACGTATSRDVPPARHKPRLSPDHFANGRLS